MDSSRFWLLAGCIEIEEKEEGNHSTEADVVITKVDTEKVDGKFRITFHLKNVGGKKANMVLLNVIVENQDGYTRLKDVNTEVVSSLEPGASATKIETIQIRAGDEKYFANVVVWWMSGSRNYHYEWEL